MANFIPVLSFGPDPELTVTFDTPPEGDPQNETLATEKEQVRSVGGQLFTSDFYDYKTFTLRFILQSNALALKLKRVFEDHALKGESFTYFPHSDDSSIRFGVELQSESVTFNRDHPDGLGGFLWSFEFTLINVNKTAPRITRLGPAPTPVPTAPDPVRRLFTTEVEQTTIDIGWDAPISTGSSQLKHYEVSIKQGNAAAVVSTTVSLTRQFTGLVANTAYTITVAAVNDDDLKSSVKTLSVTTARAPLAPPTAVRNFAASEITTTGAKFTWDAPTSSGSTALFLYELSWAKVGENPSLEEIVDASTTETTVVDEFEANTQYEATIFARNSNVHPDATKIKRDGPTTKIRFRTLVAIVAPTAVQNLIAANVGEETATLRWNAPSSTGGGAATITKYQVKVSGANDSTAVDVTSGTTHALTGLTARTQYTYQVRAVNSSNLNSPWSSVTFTTATAILVPPTPSIRLVGEQTVTLPYHLYISFRWPQVGGVDFLDIDKFRVYYRKKGATSWTLQEVNASDVQLGFGGNRSRSRIITEINWPDDNEEPDQVYEFQMSAYNSTGESPRSNTVEGTKKQMVEALYDGTKVRKRIYNRNSILTVGDYHITSELGDRDKDMDMFSIVQGEDGAPSEEGKIFIPGFRINVIREIVPSSTDPDKLAIAFEGYRVSTNSSGVFIVEVTATYNETNKRWTFSIDTTDDNNIIMTRGYISGLTAFSEQRPNPSGGKPLVRNRYMYVKWANRKLFITNQRRDFRNFVGGPIIDTTYHFSSVEEADVLRHKGASATASVYYNTAMCSFENKFWVVDFYNETAYAYKLKERTVTTPNIKLADVARVTRNSEGVITSIRSGPDLTYIYPYSSWARKSFVLLTGSSTLRLNQRNADKVYVFTTYSTTRLGVNYNQFSRPIRVPQLEFTIDNASYNERRDNSRIYNTIFVWKNRIFIGCRSNTDTVAIGSGLPHNGRIMAFKL